MRTVGFLNTEFLRLNAIGLHEMNGLADFRREFFDTLDNVGNETDVVEGKGAVRRERARCARRGDEKRKTFLHILRDKADLRACALCRVDPIKGDGIERCQLIERRGRDRADVGLQTCVGVLSVPPLAFTVPASSVCAGWPSQCRRCR